MSLASLLMLCLLRSQWWQNSSESILNDSKRRATVARLVMTQKMHRRGHKNEGGILKIDEKE